MNEKITRFGFVAIIGRPNVGKSTLLNHLLQQKLSITSRKPQTTRHQIIGIKTLEEVQIVYVDTPGLHLGQTRKLNKIMNNAAASVLGQVELVLFITDRARWGEEDDYVLELVRGQNTPVALIVNKIDLVPNKGLLLPKIAMMHEKSGLSDVLLVSALSKTGFDELENYVFTRMPIGPHLFPSEQITDKSERFLAAEYIREKIIRQLGDELPYRTAVEIESYNSDVRGIINIDAVVLVERVGQKKILVGNGGLRLKKIGTEARRDMEKAFGLKVMLKLWVKVRRGWTDDASALKLMGFE